MHRAMKEIQASLLAGQAPEWCKHSNTNNAP